MTARAFLSPFRSRKARLALAPLLAALVFPGCELFGGGDEITLHLDNSEDWVVGSYKLITWEASDDVETVDIVVDCYWQVGEMLIADDIPASNGRIVWRVSWDTRALPDEGCEVEIFGPSRHPSDRTEVPFVLREPITFYVNPESSFEGASCTRWAEPCAHPQDAIDMAASGDEIWVAEGTYTPRSGDDFVLRPKACMRVLGGFDGHEWEVDQRDLQINRTVLDGEGSVDHVVVGADELIFDGFNVTGGASDGDGAGLTFHTGEYVGASQVANCRFLDNEADGRGGGIYVGEGAMV